MQLFLVVLLSTVTVVSALAGCQGDRDKDHRPRQNCTGAGFSHVPPGLDPSTQVLVFANNRFSSLAWASFQPFPQIHEVELTGNQVPPSAAPLLPTLSVLRLGFNLISTLPDGCFSACPAVTELYLDSNTIGSLSNHAFSGLSKLEILDLSSNRIQVLPELLLHPLPAIETLYLESNQIQVIPDDWFSQKEEVPYLFLSANPWACSCALGYLRRYLDDNELNVYTRRGELITNEPESVVCQSPSRFHKRAVIHLSASDLCPSTSPAPPSPRTTASTPAPPSPRTTASTPAPPSPRTTASTPAPPSPRTTASTPAACPTSASTSAPPTSTTPHRVPPPQTATPPVVMATQAGAVPGTRTSTTDQYSSRPWPQPTSQPVRPTGPVPRGVTLAPPLTTSSTTPTSTTPHRVPPPQPATPPVVLATQAGGRAVEVGLQGAGRFCVWLFAGCLLLCLLAASTLLLASTRLLFLYCTAFRPLQASIRRRRLESARLRLLPNQRGEEAEPRGGGPLYRSVLFVHRDEEDEEDEVRFYRRSLQRVLSREEELLGWREVMEECGGTVAPGRRSYSVILRQEAEAGAEQQEWLLGAWEETTGGGARGRLEAGLQS